ncbi:hypothetical protein WICPIJ_004272 [Wickerhamomyces pijperi]|uniref:Mannosyltransferase n=1 Tax=Wickerhamomyces pijperi TaxID=599730 RepID=A0A9P8TNF2_WICPI|nr:hypothetical protein WICPIJ_004272 [Wickerhamomyces pijperi]
MFQEALTDPLYLLVLTFHVIVSPFTKVEESFNLHAIHDFLYKAPLDVTHFDHVEFPGAVPRSFIPAMLISLIAKAIQLIAKLRSKLEVLLLVRGVIGVISWIGFVYLRESLKSNLKTSEIKKETTIAVEENIKKLKKGSAKFIANQSNKKAEAADSHWSLTFWLFLISAAQYHVMFYSTRTLPNFLVLPLTNVAFGKLFRGDFKTCIVLLSFASVVCRIELAALTLSLGLVCFLYKKITVPQLFSYGLTGGALGAVLSGGVDSFYWQRFTIPELESFIFNVIEGKASEWGVSPWSSYFSSFSLKLFFPLHAPFLAFLACLNDPTKNQVLKISMFASLLFVFIMSFQGHKEWRFVVYVVPLINIAAATQAAGYTSRAFHTRWNWYKPLLMVIFGCSALSFLLATFWCEAAYFNYPGGQAMVTSQQLILQDMQKGQIPQHYGSSGSDVIIHSDTYVNSNGGSLFADISAHYPDFVSLKIDRTEDPNLLTSPLWNEFDYVVTEVSEPSSLPIAKGFKWEKYTSTRAFRGIDRSGINGQGWVRAFVMMWQRKSVIPMYVEALKCLKLEEGVFVYKKTPLA